MLTLGALVTSFQAGMADNTWPRTPWHLFLIEWENRFLLIEHTHRFFGMLLGCMTIVLTLGLWIGEPNKRLRRMSLTSQLSMLVCGALAMWLARSKQPQGPSAGLAEPILATDPTWLSYGLCVLAGVSLVMFVTAIVGKLRSSDPLRGARVFSSLFLVCILIQGLLGGFRVKLDAMFGPDFAAVHGAFSQIVLALATMTALATVSIDSPDSRRMHAESEVRIDRWALWAAHLVFFQVLAGVILRHSGSTLGWMGPRLHLLFVFPAVVAVCGTAWRILHTAAPHSVRILTKLTIGLLVCQIVLGVESWLARFTHGITAASFQQVTVSDAILRTSHSLVGYCLFAVTVALAMQTRRTRNAAELANVRSMEGAL